MFAGIPFIPVDLATIRFDTTRSAQCQVSVPPAQRHGLVQRLHGANDQSALVPVLVVLHARAVESVTGSAVAAIPAARTLRQIRMDVEPRASTIR